MSTTPIALIPAEARERIVVAANELYEQAGRERFPTVDAVRRTSRADMNAVSSVMKEWRQAQTKQAAPVAIAVPDRVQQASAEAVAALWSQAQELANESLRTAQAAWDAERQKLDELRDEIATAYEDQAKEIEGVKQQLASSQANVGRLTAEVGQLRIDIETMTTAKADAERRVELAEQRAGEVEHRANDLKAELNRAHADADQARKDAGVEAGRLAGERDAAKAELAEHKKASADELARLRADLAAATKRADDAAEEHKEQRRQTAAEVHRLAERLTKLQGERDAAVTEASNARVKAAEATGKLAALETQNAALLDALKPEGKGKKA